jgi:hypothetical protein
MNTIIIVKGQAITDRYFTGNPNETPTPSIIAQKIRVMAGAR